LDDNSTAGVLFGFDIILVTISSTYYLLDSYTVFTRSVMAVCIVTRAAFAAVFPFLVRHLFAYLGIYWGLSIPAFGVPLFAPFPFVFHKYGPRIRARCKFARQERRSTNETPNK
jgi:hypothetical protein